MKVFILLFSIFLALNLSSAQQIGAAIHTSSYDTEDPIEVGKETAYDIEIRNEGIASCTNIKLSNLIPDEMEFVSASGPGKYEVKGKETIFEPVSVLKPGEILKYKIVCKAVKAGSAKNTATLLYDQFDKSIIKEEGTSIYSGSATAVAAMHIGSYDTEDPIEVNNKTIYVVDVRNEGTAPCNNVILEDNVSQELEFVSASGPAPYKVEGNKVKFEAVPVLLPGKKLSYKIVCKAIKVGYGKNTAILKYEQFDKPVMTEEGTSIYK